MKPNLDFEFVRGRVLDVALVLDFDDRCMNRVAPGSRVRDEIRYPNADFKLRFAIIAG